ncbi:NAD-dependent epimerase/dehydratase family protein [Candidatus Frankia alpina]|uniref:NAD-dependent epimerase/dehydratase family protein n=1 Tax=Candidatus Frankia alpina TaxID=2699483 RepID=UPI0013D5EB33|nr:NAD-dependent epimerase/dehydratase family protein [Candidatus Frankia alpina]
MRALVTGSSGFVGRHMTTKLRARGYVVNEIDIAEAECPMDCRSFVFGQNSPIYDLVVHAAARAPHRAAIDGQPAASIYNRMLDAEMFEWAVRTGQRRVLYLSSSAAYPAAPPGGDRPYAERLISHRGITDAPFDQYGWGKVAGEQMAAAAAAGGVAVHIVRPFSGYGEDQGLDFPFGAFVARARQREDPFRIWGAGGQMRDWIHIDDVVAGALAVVDADERRPVNLCTGVATSMATLATLVCTAAGYWPDFEFDLRAPAGVAYRVEDPSLMRTIYTPRVPLAEGIARALAQEAAV